MSEIDELFSRLHLQNIRSNLRCGMDLISIDPDSYVQRLSKAWKPARTAIHEAIEDEEEYEKVASAVLICMGSCEDVFMEIGMKCGASIQRQLMEEVKEIT